MWLVFVAVLVFVVPRLSEQEQLVSALRDGVWSFLLGALLLTVIWYWAVVESYFYSYKVVGVLFQKIELVKVYLASLFANIITPSFGLAGAALFIKQTRHQGSSHVRGALGFAVQSLFLQIGFVITISALVVAVILSGKSVDRFSLMAASITLIIIVIQALLYITVYYRSAVVVKLLGFFASIVNRVMLRIKKRRLLPDDWSFGRVQEMRTILELLVSARSEWSRMLLISVAVFIFQILLSICLLLAFQQEVTFPVLFGFLVSGSVAGALFSGPHGIGVVEFGLTLVLSHYGIDRGAATLIAIVYRGLTFWMPFFVGFVAFRSLSLFNNVERVEQTAK